MAAVTRLHFCYQVIHRVKKNRSPERHPDPIDHLQKFDTARGMRSRCRRRYQQVNECPSVSRPPDHSGPANCTKPGQECLEQPGREALTQHSQWLFMESANLQGRVVVVVGSWLSSVGGLCSTMGSSGLSSALSGVGAGAADSTTGLSASAVKDNKSKTR
ncbi:hypothetical protein EYF80_000110 [Liparis tanakae]|uniref:Uncharacterized protein n=1 Tax=Liparis tanakae TaxID=230148 RepID=A0A4Z2JHS1_9TELE|nr:hypothetical protein EYF80_000110 [Liparis tanakae]